MKNYSKSFKMLSVLFTFIMIMSALAVCTSAVTEIYEDGNHNSRSNAQLTYDDCDNYGKISSSSDNDWWKVVANKDGIANIWLGNIPSGCYYVIAAYDDSGAELAHSDIENHDQQLLKVRIEQYRTYYIRIFSKDGTYNASKQYKFRFKNYDIGTARIFGYNKDTEENTYASAQNVISNLWNMGYPGQAFLNNTSGPVYNTFPSSRIFTIMNKAAPGYIYLNGTRLFAKSYGSTTTGINKAIDTYSYNELTNVALAMFVGDYTGSNSSSYGNLVDAAADKDVFVAVGWNTNIQLESSNAWTERLYEICKGQCTFEEALSAADAWAETYYGSLYGRRMSQRYIKGQTSALSV